MKGRPKPILLIFLLLHRNHDMAHLQNHPDSEIKINRTSKTHNHEVDCRLVIFSKQHSTMLNFQTT